MFTHSLRKEWPGRKAAPGLWSLNWRSAPPQKTQKPDTHLRSQHKRAPHPVSHSVTHSRTHSSVVRTQHAVSGSTSRLSVHCLCSCFSNALGSQASVSPGGIPLGLSVLVVPTSFTMSLAQTGGSVGFCGDVVFSSVLDSQER